jgi:hypothetical protein
MNKKKRRRRKVCTGDVEGLFLSIFNIAVSIIGILAFK